MRLRTSLGLAPCFAGFADRAIFLDLVVRGGKLGPGGDRGCLKEGSTPGLADSCSSTGGCPWGLKLKDGCR